MHYDGVKNIKIYFDKNLFIITFIATNQEIIDLLIKYGCESTLKN